MSWIGTEKGFWENSSEPWIASNYPHNGVFRAYWKNPIFIDNESGPHERLLNEVKNNGFPIKHYTEFQDDTDNEAYTNPPEWLGDVTMDPNEEGAGHLRWEWSYENGMRSDGESKGWWPDGQIKFIWNWKDGRLDGPFKSWYSTGQVSNEGYYYTDREVDTTSDRTLWSIDEKISNLHREAEKTLHGECSSYTMEGRLLSRGKYDKGKLIEDIYSIKEIEDVCIIVQARLGSQRVPYKMTRSFAGTTLVDILFEKLKSSKVIPKQNIYFSAHEEPLREIGVRHGINIFDRSDTSAAEDDNLQIIYEWHDKLPFKYVILISACNPLLKIETIDSFIESFLKSGKDGSFAVFEKKTYYWDKNKKPITDWKGATIMNTKVVEPIYEAAHCLYASRMDVIKNGNWMDIKSPPEPELFTIDELEAFDIDYEWQFKVGENLYETLK